MYILPMYVPFMCIGPTTLLLYGQYILNMAYMMYVRRTFIVYILPGMITTVPVGSRTYVTVYNRCIPLLLFIVILYLVNCALELNTSLNKVCTGTKKFHDISSCACTFFPILPRTSNDDSSREVIEDESSMTVSPTAC